MQVSQILLPVLIPLLLAGATAQAQIAHGYSNLFAFDTVMEVDGGERHSRGTALTSISPNPFSTQTTIEFTLAEAGVVELAVFDVRGRLVRTLNRESRIRGHYRAAWNGCDDEGRPMPTSVYFCRLASSHEVQTRILILVK